MADEMDRIRNLEKIVYRLLVLLQSRSVDHESLLRLIDAIPLTSRIRATNDIIDGR